VVVIGRFHIRERMACDGPHTATVSTLKPADGADVVIETFDSRSLITEAVWASDGRERLQAHKGITACLSRFLRATSSGAEEVMLAPLSPSLRFGSPHMTAIAAGINWVGCVFRAKRQPIGFARATVRAIWPVAH